MYNLIATSTFGIESITAKELKALGYEELEIENGKVTFEGDEMDIAIANVHLRTADRVLIKMAEFEARTFEELFQGTKNVKWHEIIPKDGIMHVVGKSVKSTLHSVPDCQSIVKKAVVSSMSEHYGIETFSESGSTYKIEVAILKDKVTLTIDTTGPGLHKRGYRELAGIAPLKETLAASMLLISRWNEKFDLIDPFCGSGTILIEAAMIAQNIAPGCNRNFVAEEWSDDIKNTFAMVKDGAKKAIKDKEINLIGYDINYRVLKVAMENAQKAGVDKYIKFQKRDFMNFSSSKKNGFIVSNPPYGERIGERETLQPLYKYMGQMKRKLNDWDFNILTSIDGFEKMLDLKATKNRKLYNGTIKCYYYQYFDNNKIKNPGDTLINNLMD
ncbi:THUMP domain-containing class I SAM-dependent RNA methyltransferase [Clostridium taeniosporum]|uniref:Class I SAM-dependent RNA methyltransferase n=1 Tax=Clostridium taeniosporum TaxID=394958 RepID=A0A1D7XL73_9CLOT|nr:class I SAM-dependent RNA methyltransferase [Clostridium taeniosporum]AOR23930.1 class I SAM-dependent RNA methyltransferase [Clostridium taeniosporum]